VPSFAHFPGRGPSAGPGGSSRFGPGFLGDKPRPRRLGGSIGRVANLFRPEFGFIVLIVLFSVIETGLVMAGPWLIGREIDLMNRGLGQMGPEFIRITLLLLVSYALAALASSINGLIMAGLSQRLVSGMRQSLFASLTRLPLAFFDRRSHGDIMSRVANDVDAVSITLTQSFAQLIASAISVSATLALMLCLNPLLALASLLPVPLVFLLTRGISKRTRSLFKAQQAALGAVNGRVEESITGIEAVKAFGREEALLKAFEEENEALRKIGSRAQIWTGFLMPIMNVIGNLGYASVSIVGGILAVGGGISVGLVASFLSWSRQFVRPLNEIANTWNSMMSALAGAERVFEVLDEEPEPDSPTGAPLVGEGAGELEFRSVDFAYLPGVPVISGLSFLAHPGSRTAIVGRTGAGKTTIANLLQRFYQPESGAIRLDGVDITNYDKKSLRRAFGVVLQDTWLFSGSVRDNITYARPDADEDSIARALSNSGAAEAIARLSHGLDTRILEGGRNLSQGERQLVALARAVLGEPRFLILDEATSSIDARTELHIQRSMLAMMGKRTSVVIAHRLSTIRDADLIIVLDSGRVVESGSHESLLALGGYYASLVEAQAGGREI
ncbi:MAG: ABC transporter ATP-binding protein, partial [Spirochaetota bacterium]